jgi:hypothetical protein
MERESICPEKDYLTNLTVAKILKISPEIINDMVDNGVVRPLKEPMLNGRKLWGLDDIFRLYLALRLRQEFREKYKSTYGVLMFDEINRDILSVQRVRGPEIRKSEGWLAVLEKAAEQGLVINEEENAS